MSWACRDPLFPSPGTQCDPSTSLHPTATTQIQATIASYLGTTTPPPWLPSFHPTAQSIFQQQPKGRYQNPESGYPTPLLKALQCFSVDLRLKTKPHVLPMGPAGCPETSPCPCPLCSPAVPHRPPCFPTLPSSFLPQGLCVCYSRHLECSSHGGLLSVDMQINE